MQRAAGLELIDVHYSYGTNAVLHGLHLSVPAGECLALLGASGCGKSTCLQLIAGLLQPSHGDIMLAGRSLLAMPAELRPVGMVFQDFLLFPHLTVADNIAFALTMRGVPKRARLEAVSKMLSHMQLEGLSSRYPRQLSGGQQQRVALARSLIAEPQLLLLDEPLANLDAHLRTTTGQFIRELQRERSITTVLVTHDQHEAASLADRIALLIDGQLAQVGSAEDIMMRPQSVAVARFIGAVNLLPATVHSPELVAWRGLLLPCPTPYSAGNNVQLYIRPEHVQLQRGTIPAIIRERHHLGSGVRYSLEVAGGLLYALSHDLPAIEAEHITIALPTLWAMPSE